MLIPFLAAFFINGLYEVTQEDQPLYFIRKFFDQFGMHHDYYGGIYDDPIAIPTEAKMWYYPFLYCPACMSSFWGGSIFVVYSLFTGVTMWLLPFHVIATYGIVVYLRNQWYN